MDYFSPFDEGIVNVLPLVQSPQKVIENVEKKIE